MHTVDYLPSFNPIKAVNLKFGFDVFNQCHVMHAKFEAAGFVCFGVTLGNVEGAV